MPVFQALGTSTIDFPVKPLTIMVLLMTDDNEPDPKIQKSGAELSAEAGIGRGCPFCGRREKTIRDWHFLRLADTNTTQVECFSCGARGPRCTAATNGTDLLEALKLWNERHVQAPLLQSRSVTAPSRMCMRERSAPPVVFAVWFCGFWSYNLCFCH